MSRRRSSVAWHTPSPASCTVAARAECPTTAMRSPVATTSYKRSYRNKKSEASRVEEEAL